MNKSQATVFESHIQKYAFKYYPDVKPDQAAIEFMGVQERTASTLYRYRVQDNSHSHSILVKVPVFRNHLEGINGNSGNPPRLFPRTDPEKMHWLEYSALREIEGYFRQIDRQSLGAVHILDYLPEYRAILMEEVRFPSLRQLFLRENRFQALFSNQELYSAFRNAGMWLRHFHLMPEGGYVKERHTDRDAYIESVKKLTDFLEKLFHGSPFIKKVGRTAGEVARSILPDCFTLGLGHGDFAMRNILVGPGARVTVFDTFAKWRVPIYEDIGYFLNGLQMSRPQVISQGLTFSSQKLIAFEKAFLSGYFEENLIPMVAIRLYELLALLDKWASTHVNLRSSKKMMGKVTRRVTAGMVNRYFRARALALVREVSQQEMAFIYD